MLTRELPEDLIRRHNLEKRRVSRGPGADTEIRFLLRDRSPLLPVWHHNQLLIVAWGNQSRRSRLPQSGWCQQESLEAGRWRDMNPEPVEVLAQFGFDRGIWYQVTEGMRGIIVADEQDQLRVFLLTQPASHYYEIMTRNERMPVLIGQTI